MNPTTSGLFEVPDSAGIFAVAQSLWTECFEKADRTKREELSETYNGLDQMMREVMRVGALFEEWSCRHVDFESFGEVWPYFIADNFGSAWLEVGFASSLDEFDEDDCLRMAWQLGIPIRYESTLPLPVDVMVENPIPGSAFTRLRIQTIRRVMGESAFEPFTASDELFEEDCEPAVFGLYGVLTSSQLEHIADRETYADVLRLARQLAPGVQFPEQVVVRRGSEGSHLFPA